MTSEIYLYRRIGNQEWATCDKPRFVELSSHRLFDTKICYASPPAPVSVVLPVDWQDQLFAEMERRFDLRKQIDNDHMVYDDTQVGVEFARDWIAACLDKVKELNQ